MMALTVRQPWAWAIAQGHKPVDNRVWSSAYRGELLIHAGRSWDLAGAELVPTLLPPGVLTPGMWRQTLPQGAVVAVVRLVGVCPGEPGCGCGPWAAAGHRHWQLRDAQRLPEPIRVGGRQGLWRLPGWAIKAVRRQLDQVTSHAGVGTRPRRRHCEDTARAVVAELDEDPEVARHG